MYSILNEWISSQFFPQIHHGTTKAHIIWVDGRPSLSIASASLKIQDNFKNYHDCKTILPQKNVTLVDHNGGFTLPKTYNEASMD